MKGLICMNKKSNYFYVWDIEIAERIRDLTGQVYYKFNDRYTNDLFFSFKWSKEVVVAYKMVMQYKSKLEKGII